MHTKAHVAPVKCDFSFKKSEMWPFLFNMEKKEDYVQQRKQL